MKKDFSYLFEIIYNNFKKSPLVSEFGTAKLSLAKALGVSQGKMQYWEKGNWPSAEDLEVLHKKMGFSYRWLITGEGEPFDETSPSGAPAIGTRVEELERQKADLTQKLLAAKDELLAAKDTIIALQEENKRRGEWEQPARSTQRRRDNPESVTASKPAPSVSSEASREEYNKQ